MKRIVLPLDGMTRVDALEIASRVSAEVWGFKVNDLLVDEGVQIVKELKQFGRVFADPKLYDIPNTVNNSIRKLDAAQCDLITIHASGGAKMIEAATKAASHAKILCVTALTSLSNEETSLVYKRTAKECVLDFAKIALNAGAYGIVCSPEELEMLSAYPDLSSLARVVPGIRPTWYGKADDQTRISTPEVAIARGATLLVVGRPIIEASDPLEACRKLNAEIQEGTQ